MALKPIEVTPQYILSESSPQETQAIPSDLKEWGYDGGTTDHALKACNYSAAAEVLHRVQCTSRRTIMGSKKQKQNQWI